MATGPAEPFASDETRTKDGAPAPGKANGQKSAIAIDPSVYLGPRSSGPWRLRHMMYLVAAAAIVIWIVLQASDSPAILTLFILGAIVFAFASILGGSVILARRRSTRQDSLLGVLAIAAEQEMPLAPAVAAFADQYGGRSYRRIMDLAAQLNWGTPLADALERSRKLVSRDSVLLARIGQTADRLPRALRMAATTRSTQLPFWTAITARLSYILGLLLAMQTISWFIFYFIIPKFEAIFKDFNVSLPELTLWVIDFSHTIIKYGLITMWIPIVELALLVFLPFSFLAWGNYTVPLFDRLLGRRHTALILRSLGLIVEGGKPIGLGLSILSRHYPTEWVRRRLLLASSDVHHGLDWIDALSRHRLIRPADAEVLKSAAEVGNLSWALFELAETAERRLTTRFQMVVQTLFPLVVVMLGMAVFVMAVAYFLPLVEIITELTRQ